METKSLSIRLPGEEMTSVPASIASILRGEVEAIQEHWLVSNDRVRDLPWRGK
jgi:hypothetical protein